PCTCAARRRRKAPTGAASTSTPSTSERGGAGGALGAPTRAERRSRRRTAVGAGAGGRKASAGRRSFTAAVNVGRQRDAPGAAGDAHRRAAQAGRTTSAVWSLLPGPRRRRRRADAIPNGG